MRSNKVRLGKLTSVNVNTNR